MSTRIIATTTRSAPLDDSLPLHGSPPLIGSVFAMRSRLGCHQEVPCFGSAILPYVPSPIRREEDSGVLSQIFPDSHRPSPELDRVGSSSCLDTGFCRGGVTTLQSSLHATARMVARPPVSVRPGDSSPAAEDFYARAFPKKGHPFLESGITTRHPWEDTVTGLAPAGSLPFQAATSSLHSSIQGLWPQVIVLVAAPHTVTKPRG